MLANALSSGRTLAQARHWSSDTAGGGTSRIHWGDRVAVAFISDRASLVGVMQRDKLSERVSYGLSPEPINKSVITAAEPSTDS